MSSLVAHSAVTSIHDLPDSSRLWVFHTSRDLSDQEAMDFGTQLRAFIDTWAAHNVELVAASEIVHNRFVFVAVDTARVGPSGCSIDTLSRKLVELSVKIGVDVLDAPAICYRNAEHTIVSCTRSEFAASVRQGAVDGNTVVFDETISNLHALRSGKWELPAEQTWHKAAFGL